MKRDGLVSLKEEKLDSLLDIKSINEHTSLKEIIDFSISQLEKNQDIEPIKERFKEVFIPLCTGDGSLSSLVIPNKKDDSNIQVLGNSLSKDQGERFINEIFDDLIPSKLKLYNDLIKGDIKEISGSFISKLLFKVLIKITNEDVRKDFIKSSLDNSNITWNDDNISKVTRKLRTTL